MTKEEATAKDKILAYLKDHNGRNFSKDVELAEKLKLEISTIVHYCKEMELDEYIQTTHSMDGWSFRILDSGLHFLDIGGYTAEFNREQQELDTLESDRQDELLTRKVTRNTAWWSIFISIVAVAIAALSLISQILGWF